MFAHLFTTIGVVLSLCIPAMGDGNIIYVDAQADQEPHDGSDWAHAFVGLGEALAAAGPETEIRIADGAYLPDVTGLTDPRAATFELVQGTTLRGGFAGYGAADPDANDPTLYETILSGDIGVPGEAADNCYHVLRGSNLDNSTVVEGVTITLGNANVPGGQREGGGMLLSGASPTIRGCIFRENEAEFGGAVFNSAGHPTFVATTFKDNTSSSSGGAMYNYNVRSEPAPSFIGCAFRGNWAEGYGGAMRNYDNLVDVNDCEFHENISEYGGGAVANGGATVATFTRCLFAANRADTLFALRDVLGGAILNTETTEGSLISCAFHLNVANSTLPGISYGGALALSNTANVTITNCTMVGQHANLGNAVFSRENSATTVTSSILSNGGNEIVLDGSPVITVSYSAVTDSWPGIGNIDDDPLLDDLHLQPGSPCINSGDPNYSLATGDRDRDGHPRVLCDRVDMGAFEFGIGDYDCNQAVDLDDFLHWSDCMTGPAAGPYATGCEAFDYEFDEDVDLADIAGFQNTFEGMP
jgi:hypothetical protein